MRILQISSASSFGGGERHYVDLCRGLTDAGHEVFAAVRPANEWSERIGFLPPGNIFRVPLRNTLDLVSSNRLAQIMREESIEIAHAHMARDYPLIALASRRSRGTKLVITRHVMFPLKNVHKLLLKNVSAAIAVSEAVRANLSKTFPEEKVYCVPNGLSVEPLPNRETAAKEFKFEHNISYDDTVVTNVGELSKMKGQREFVIAAEEIVKAAPKVFFVIVGKDPTFDRGYRRDLKRLVKILGLQERFLFLDWIDDMAPLMAATDVFVSSSRSESFGLAILEAMASGNAVVATKTDGAKELIKNGVDGSLVAINDPVAMAKSVTNLLANGDLRNSIGKAAASKAQNNFSLDQMIEKTLDVYHRVLNK